MMPRSAVVPMVRRPAAVVATLSPLLRPMPFGFFFGFDFLAEFFVFGVFGFAAFAFVFGFFASVRFVFAPVVAFGFVRFGFVVGGEREVRCGGGGGQAGGVRRGRRGKQHQGEEQ
jgi:hypothetical protein